MSFEDQEQNIPVREKENYMDNTLKYFNERFADFRDVDLECENVLLCGKPQAGKSAFTFAIACWMMLIKKSCVFVVRNYTQDASEMIAKFDRFSREYWVHMERLGYETTMFEAVNASVMSLVSDGKDEDGKDIMRIQDTVEIKEALYGKKKKLVVALANGTQLRCLNGVLADTDEHLVLFTDEADAVGYAEVIEPGPARHAAREYRALRERASQEVEISATVWDVLIGNEGLLSTNIVTIRPPPSYKGVRNGVQFVNLPDPLEKWTYDLSLIEEDSNLIHFYGMMSQTPPFDALRYNCEVLHPVICLHKTRREKEHHRQFAQLFRRDAEWSKLWTVITECDEGVMLYSHSLRNGTVTITGQSRVDKCGKGVFHFRKIIMPEILQWLFENGGADRFSHIAIKSGDFSGRSRSYVSSNGIWHLTHQYYSPALSASAPHLIQAQRLLHDRPDSIPLTEYAHEDTIDAIKKADLIQEEQLVRLSQLKTSVLTSSRLTEEVWSADKVPRRRRLCCGQVNRRFRVKRVSGPDGGWPCARYGVFQEDTAIVPDQIFLLKDDRVNIAECYRNVYYAVMTSLFNVGEGVWHRRAAIITDVLRDDMSALTKKTLEARLKDFGQKSRLHTRVDSEAHTGVLLRKTGKEWELRVN